MNLGDGVGVHNKTAVGLPEMDAEMGSSVTKLAKPFTQAELPA